MGRIFCDETCVRSYECDILKHVRDGLHVKPFTFGLEICQFKIKGTPVYSGGAAFCCDPPCSSTSAKC